MDLDIENAVTYLVDPIDYLHVDAADHSYQEALAFHDSGTEAIQRVLARIRKTHPEFDCLDLLELGAGLAALR